MAQEPAGTTTQNENAGVQQDKNTGVHQNMNTHSPQSGYNDLQNDPTIKGKTQLTKQGTKMRSKMKMETRPKMRTKMDMRTHMGVKMNRRDYKRRPKITTTKQTPTPCPAPWKNDMTHEQKLTYWPGNEKMTFHQSYAYTRESTVKVRKSFRPTQWYKPSATST